MSKNILFVVEGGRSEPRFLHNLMRTFRSDVSYDVFTYRTNIHKSSRACSSTGTSTMTWIS